MAAAAPTSRLRPSHRPVRPNAMYMRPARKSLLASSRPILPAPHYAGRSHARQHQDAIGDTLELKGRDCRPSRRSGLFLACLHQSGVEPDRIELRVIVLPALVGLLSVARTDDEAGLLRLGLEFRILQRSDDVRFEEVEPIFRNAFRASNATPGTHNDIKTLLAEGWD